MMHVFVAAEADASVVVGDYGRCHYSHVADNSLPTYNEVVLQRTLGGSHYVALFLVLCHVIVSCVSVC